MPYEDRAQVAGYAVPGKPQSPTVSGRLEEIGNRLGGAIERAREIQRRISGSRPSEVEGECPEMSSLAGTLELLEAGAHKLDRVLSQILEEL
jgi:hypothetical protein